MNPRKYDDSVALREFEPPWHFERDNVFVRIERVLKLKEQLVDSLEVLSEYIEKCESGDEISIKDQDRVHRAYRRLMEMTDIYRYIFPELATTRWFSWFNEEVAHGYWRIEDGRYSDITEDESQKRGLQGECGRVVRHTSDSSSQGIITEVEHFIERKGREFLSGDTPERYRPEIEEARDLYCLGYYSTALLVLGRAVDRALLELGNVRDIEKVRAYGKNIEWSDAKFYQRNEALSEANMPEKDGKVISRKEYLHISLLIDYRNKVAHSGYRDIEKEEAERQMMDAINLLEVLGEKIDYLKSISESKIQTISTQKVD